MKKSKKGIIIAIGLETYLVVDCLNKEKADFIAFIVNNKTVELFPEIYENLDYKPKEYRKFFIKDVESSSEAVSEFLNAFYWLTEGKKVRQIKVDATNTLKTVAVPVYFTANFIELFKDLINEEVEIKSVFTNCDWDIIETDSIRTAKPVLGTERIIELEHPMNTIGFILCSMACDFFNKGYYPRAKKFFEMLEKNTAGEQNLLYKGLTLLSLSYDLWDKFNIKDAEEELEKSIYHLNKVNKFGFVDKIMKKIKINLEVLKKIQKGNQLNKIIDIFENGNRRVKAEKFDGAIARYYRCLGMIAQYALKKYGIETKEPNFSKLSEKVIKKYKEERNGSLPEKYKGGVGGIALKDAFLLLYCLNDPIGQKYKEIEPKFIGLLAARNQSILAHGSKPINEKRAEKFKEEIVKPFLIEVLENENIDLDKELEKHQYPELSPNIKNLFLDLKRM